MLSGSTTLTSSLLSSHQKWIPHCLMIQVRTAFEMILLSSVTFASLSWFFFRCLPSLDEGPALPTKQNEEFRPFIRRLPEFKFWWVVTLRGDILRSHGIAWWVQFSPENKWIELIQWHTEIPEMKPNDFYHVESSD